jgi:hypothetical protein
VSDVVGTATVVVTAPLSGRVSSAEPQVLDVVDGLVEQLCDVVVVEAINDASTVSVTRH